MSSLPLVAIIGRPNVGKSTLFNALIGKRKSIVSDIAGTTRDTVIERVTSIDVHFWLLDTAGLTDSQGDSLEEEIQTQARLAADKADIILFAIDAKKELTRDDQDIIDLLRKSKKEVIFLANKVDDGKEERAYEYMNTGFGMPLVISAKNYTGIWALEDKIEETLLKKFPKTEEVITEEDERIKIAFIGRPNVGKSSLLNAFLGEKRSVVSDVSGTTRDTIDTEYTDTQGNQFLFLDTAGLRRKGKVGREIEFWSTVRTTQAISESDICCVMLDALEGVTHQDLTIIGKIIEEGKGLVLGVNKFDLAYEKAQQREESDERELDEVKMWGEDLNTIKQKYMHYLTHKISFAGWAPVLFFSAKTGKGIDAILESAQAIATERTRRIATADLNRFIPDLYYGHVTPSVGNKVGKIKFVSQVSTAPPKFVFHVNNRAAFHSTYRRYMENKLREKYGFHGTPIIVDVRDAMDEFRGNKKKK